VFIVSASGGRKPQFWANFDIWGLPYRPPFTSEDQIWCAVADPRSTRTGQMSYVVVIEDFFLSLSCILYHCYIIMVDVTDTTVVPAYYGHDRRVYSTNPL